MAKEQVHSLGALSSMQRGAQSLRRIRDFERCMIAIVDRKTVPHIGPHVAEVEGRLLELLEVIARRPSHVDRDG